VSKRWAAGDDPISMLLTFAVPSAFRPVCGRSRRWRARALRLAASVGLGLLATAAAAQPLIIHTLQHRPAEEVLPLLQPHIEPGGVVNGQGEKLFLRVSENNRQQLLSLLAEVDRPPRRLLISVRQEGGSEREALAAGGEMAFTGAGASLHLHGDRRSRDERQTVSQQLQTVEGGRAWIRIGTSLPLPFRQTWMTPRGTEVQQGIAWRDVGSGFAVQPRLQGERVMLEITPMLESAGSIAGRIDSRHLSTTVSGRLGEWLPLGGSHREQQGDARQIVSGASLRQREEHRVWLKVEVLP